MKKLEFKPSDFGKNHPGDWTIYSFVEMASAAQATFDDWYRENIESAPLVFNYNEGLSSWWNPKEMPTTAVNPTRQARLIDIQEIKKECKHEPLGRIGNKNSRWHEGGRSLSNGLVKLDSFECKLCGISLEPDWKEVKP